MANNWIGVRPERCDICKRVWRKGIGNTFVDGATVAGPWACMCIVCHLLQGIGYGEGVGQAYNLDTGERIDRPDIQFVRNPKPNVTDLTCPDNRPHVWFDLDISFRECQRCGERVRKKGVDA